jgi:DNA polymerase III subunit epsilon
MRQVILDTETTGLEPELGHRIIEIGCIELVGRRRTGRTFHRYLRPERQLDYAALRVHGVTAEFLAEQPRFADIADELLEFIGDAELVIHNAAFDLAFLDAELGRLGAPQRRLPAAERVLDTLALARQLHPGQRNGLDALCKRYGVDNSRRELHGALLDAELLLDVYLAMTGGQGALTLETSKAAVSAACDTGRASRPGVPLLVRRASEWEVAAHEEMLKVLDRTSGGRTVWRALERGS